MLARKTFRPLRRQASFLTIDATTEHRVATPNAVLPAALRVEPIDEVDVDVSTQSKRKRGYWSKLENRVAFFNGVSDRLKIKEPADWYSVTKEDVVTSGGGSFLKFYKSSLIKALNEVHPGHEWLPWKFTKASKSFWKSQANHKSFLDWAFQQLGLKSAEDWYRISATQIDNLGGRSLLLHYKSNMYLALKTVYPDHEWDSVRFHRVERNRWASKATQKAFFDSVEKNIGMQSKEEWYTMTRTKIRELGGSAIINRYYNGSLFAALASVYADHSWMPWRLKSAHLKVWQDEFIRKRFFEWLFQTLGKTTYQDILSVTLEDIEKHGGSTLMKTHYGNSLAKALKANYPEHTWYPWHFKSVPNRFWHDKENRKAFLDYIASKYSFTTYDKWYNVDRQIINDEGGSSMLQTVFKGSVASALADTYPGHIWLPWMFEKAPDKYWSDDTRLRFFEWFRVANRLETLEDWYKVSPKDIAAAGGSSLLNRAHDGSLAESLLKAYPDHNWHPWLFATVPMGYWEDNYNHRKFFDWLYVHLRLKSMSEWHSVTKLQVQGNGGAGLLATYYGDSLKAALHTVYPYHRWEWT